MVKERDFTERIIGKSVTTPTKTGIYSVNGSGNLDLGVEPLHEENVLELSIFSLSNFVFSFNVVYGFL